MTPSSVLRLLARGRRLAKGQPLNLNVVISRPFTSTNKSEPKTESSKSENESTTGTGDDSAGESKGVDVFMTAVRVMVVLGVVSSMVDNNRILEEGNKDMKIATELERKMEEATETILTEEWRQATKEKIEKGDKFALKKALNELLVIRSDNSDGDMEG